MANIYSYDTANWNYNNVTPTADGGFRFSGIGAYAETTILGNNTGPLSSDLYFRGFVSPLQYNLTQGLRCRLDVYSKQDSDAVNWDVESHFIYLKADSTGAINQKVTTSGGYFGFYDHIDIKLESMLDANFTSNIIDLTSFIIDDVGLIPDLPEIRGKIVDHEADLNKYGLQLKEILGDETEDGRLTIAEERVTTLEAGQLIFSETFAEGGINLFANPTYGGRYAPDKTGWYSGFTVGVFNSRFEGSTVGEALTVIGNLTITQISEYNW